MHLKEVRKCPECKKPGVQTAELYPHGTACLNCRSHVEVDTWFIVLLVIFLVVGTHLDFNYWHTGFLGFITVIMMAAIGIGLRWVYPNLMPLKHYKDNGL